MDRLSSAAAADRATSRRNMGFDALRAAMTLLVVFHHTAIVYGAIGGWYYHEIPPGRNLSSILLVFFCTVNQAYFMGLFFLLAGYFTPTAIVHKGASRFIADRLMRLLLPLLFFGWILGPATIALAQTSRGRPFMATLLRLWSEGTFENGPLWFAQALLIFSLAAVIVLRLLRTDRAIDAAKRWPFPSNTALALAAIATGAAALALRQVWPVGLNVWGLQLGYFASYVALFAFGCAAAYPRWLEQLPAARVQRWRRVCRLALPVLPIVYFLGDVLPAVKGRPLDVVYAFWEPLVAWGAIMMLLDRFQRRLPSLGPFWTALTRRAYAIYVVHPPVLVAVALAWRNVAAPALLKFAVTGTLTCAICFLMAGALLRVPWLRRVL